MIDKVSILVLMDVSFRLGKAPRKGGPIERFHPCFNGCVFQTFEKDEAEPIFNEFPSLF